jgi:hypothetical protein
VRDSIFDTSGVNHIKAKEKIYRKGSFDGVPEAVRGSLGWLRIFGRDKDQRRMLRQFEGSADLPAVRFLDYFATGTRAADEQEPSGAITLICSNWYVNGGVEKA